MYEAYYIKINIPVPTMTMQMSKAKAIASKRYLLNSNGLVALVNNVDTKLIPFISNDGGSGRCA